MNVLIVDDDKLARKGLIAVIDWEQYGLCVVGDVQNGKKALEFLENHPVDLVFTDIDHFDGCADAGDERAGADENL